MSSKNDGFKRIDVMLEDWLKQDLKSFMGKHRIKSKTEGLHRYIESLKDQIAKEKPISMNEGKKAHEVECEFATLLKAENKIHCKCTYPSIKKWLPRNRKVDPQVCKTCYPKIEQIQQWIAERKENSMPTRPESLAEPALCHLTQQWFRDYADFPCWQNPSWKCPNEKCEIQPRR